jgi:hypothetical protein
MALKHGKPNALNLLGIRRVHFPARHFHYTVLGKFIVNKSNKINDWIFYNLNGRYYLGNSLQLDETNSLVHMLKVGFENEKELSIFLLSYSEI